jgi:hypothetical protein
LTPQSYYYIGGNVGGPISMFGFNKNKDKLFFWGGYENMRQKPYNSPVEFNVPTAAQLSGDFNNAGLPTEIFNPATNSGIYQPAYALPCNTNDGWQGCSTADSPWGGYGSGTIPNLKSYFDTNGIAITGLSPAANQTPNANNGWNNFGYSPNTPTNRWEATGKVTYAFNDNNKLWGSYTYQTETDNHPLSVWWAPEWTIPVSFGSGRKRNRQRLPGQLHPRVQRFHHQRIRLLLCEVHQRRIAGQSEGGQPLHGGLPG